MKLSRKLFSATAALGLAVLATVGSTYAWFSVNDTVTVTGMTAQTKVSSNLLISADNVEANFEAPSLIQTVSGLLEPVSTINGVNFFYTVNAKADGSAKTAEYVAYDQAAFRTAYKQPTAVGYVDYSFYLKAVSTEGVADIVAMTKCNLLYNDAALSHDETAWRVALFVKETSKTSAGCTPVSDSDAAIETNLVTILDLSTAENQTANSAVKAATGAGNVALVVNHDEEAIVDDTFTTVAATKYYKVVVRLWLEGEDTTCTNETFAALTANYKLDLEFKIGPSAEVTPADELVSTLS